MKVILDTNVWLSAIFWKGEADKLINNIQKKKIEIVITKKILSEIVNVLNQESKFQKFIDNRNIAIKDLINTVLDISQFVVSKSIIDVIKEHPADNMILESAIDGAANYIISYNKHLLKLKEFKGIKVLKPSEFLEIIK